MPYLPRIFVPACFLALSFSCVGDETDAVDSQFSLTLSASEGEGLLAFVNDCVATLEMLDDDARLDARAARNIVESRNGIDQSCGTTDDTPFASIEALDAVPWVGDAALARLLAHAEILGYMPAGTLVIEGVSFESGEAEGVLAIVNGASLEILDDDIALDGRAAAAIVENRPFTGLEVAANIAALADLPYVGKSALQKLKDYAPAWSDCATPGTVIKGVSFSNLAAHDTLDFVNQAPISVLASISGIGNVLSDRIVNFRPYENMEQLGELQGIGASVLGTIDQERDANWCGLEGARCGCPAGASYRPPYVGFDENNLYYFLAYGERWLAEREVDSGFLSHDGSQVVMTDVQVTDDPDGWQDISTQVFDRLWDCCLQHQYDGTPIELGKTRQGVLHLGRIINANDDKPYVLAYWRDIDDASFGWIFEKDASGLWVLSGEVFLN